jgi:hypothetical protein
LSIVAEREEKFLRPLKFFDNSDTTLEEVKTLSGSETAFVAIGAVGLLLLLLSFVLGEVEHDVELSHPELDVGHEVESHDLGHAGDLHTPSWLSMKVITASMVGFGAFGYIASSSGIPELLAWPIAAVGFLALGAGTLFLVLKPLASQQSNTLLSRASYRGLIAKVTLEIPAGRSGFVVFQDRNGARVTQQAVAAAEGDAIAQGTEVYIVDITESGVTVMPSSPLNQLEE